MKANMALLTERIGAFPRRSIAHRPTPLQPMDRLSRHLGGPRLWCKRDDQTGLAFGGNKARKLDFIVADALAQGADTLVSWAGVQSNWCRQTAAAAAEVGMACELVLFQKPPFTGEMDGNLLLDRLLGARVEIVPLPKGTPTMALADVEPWVEAAAERVRRRGGVPYIAPIGGSIPEGSMRLPWGAIGYVEGLVEIYQQSQALGLRPRAIVMATGSGATQAGLLVGARLLDPDLRVVGISVSDPRERMAGWVASITEQTFDLLRLEERLAPERLEVRDEYLGAGYGVLEPPVAEAIRLVASLEGMLLDPVYTGKGMTGLLDLVARGLLDAEGDIIFLHSGGTPALFPYREGLLPQEESTPAAKPS